MYPNGHCSIHDVIIVGAGVAGLTAAQILQEEGIHGLVLEAGPNIGGRIVSHPWSEVMIDFGAQWIHGPEGNPITPLARQAGVQCLPTDFHNLRVFQVNGKPLPDDILGQYAGEYEALTERVFAMALKAPRNQSVADGFRMLLKEANLTEQDWKLLNWFWKATEVASAVDMEAMSLRYADDDEEFGGGDCMFKEGFQWLPDMLSKGLTIHVNEPVTVINYQGFPIEVHTPKGIYGASHVIVTAPLGVLQKGRIRFQPPLPDAKQTALRQLAMGVLNKFIMEFPRDFWHEDREFIGFMNESDLFFPVYMNLVPVLNRPILIAFVGGKMARKMEMLTDDEITRIALRPLCTAYGSVAEPIRVHYTRWGQDNRFFGAYSHVPVGGTSKAYDVLAKPIQNRVFFAGEATSRRYRGTVHGAYLSGRRAARQILQLRESSTALS